MHIKKEKEKKETKPKLRTNETSHITIFDHLLSISRQISFSLVNPSSTACSILSSTLSLSTSVPFAGDLSPPPSLQRRSTGLGFAAHYVSCTALCVCEVAIFSQRNRTSLRIRSVKSNCLSSILLFSALILGNR